MDSKKACPHCGCANSVVRPGFAYYQRVCSGCGHSFNIYGGTGQVQDDDEADWAAGRKQVCPKCGGSGESAASLSEGAGCEVCKGRGEIRVTDTGQAPAEAPESEGGATKYEVLETLTWIAEDHPDGELREPAPRIALKAITLIERDGDRETALRELVETIRSLSLHRIPIAIRPALTRAEAALPTKEK